MPLTVYVPKDLEKYKKHPKSVVFSADLEAGMYVFVQDVDGKVRVLPDGCHAHPAVHGRPWPCSTCGIRW
jgi:hypothetical protein